jgi:LemA protein
VDLVALGIAAAIGALLLVGLLTYNRLVRLRNRAEAAWSDIDVYLQRRHELIPNLVATVRGYAAHERETLDAVVAARDAATAAEGAGAAVQDGVEGQLDRALARFAAVAEAYPDLKADARFRDLAAELSSTESKVAFSRQLYNDTVTAYQTAIESFPGVLLAGPAGFQPPALFRAGTAERAVVPVELGADEPRAEGGR